MHSLDDAIGGGMESAAAAGWPQVDDKGFTNGDLALLEDVYHRGVAHRSWGPAQFAANDFSHYLAIWDKPPIACEPPLMAIVRFDKTGTYALLVQGRIVANGRSLETILPAVSIAEARTA